MSRKRWVARGLFAGASILVPLVLLEAVCFAYLRGGIALRPAWIGYALRVFDQSDRDYVQYDRDCARYDAELTYTLRPGRCTFAGREFSVSFRINRAGLRDDERSLHRPDVVVLGDSHAMGWGVEQESAFPQLVERRTGLSVLNAAISSYGTAREVALLRRLDLSRARAFLIQYCSNDWSENRFYCTHGGRLAPMPRSAYESIVREVAASRSYWFGQYVSRAIEAQILRRAQRIASNPVHLRPLTREEKAGLEAEYFLRILGRQPCFRGRPVFLLELDDHGIADSAFLTAVAARNAALPAGRRLDLRPIDLRGSLPESAYYALDDHLKAAGHRIVADRILAEWRRTGFYPAAPSARPNRR